jgi:transposase-like protein
LKRNYTRFKLECCRQVATDHKRPTQLCREHNLSESVLLRWRKEYEARDEEALTEAALLPRGGSGGEDSEAGVLVCGKLALENDILKKGLGKYRSNEGTP